MKWYDYSIGERFVITALELALKPEVDIQKRELVVDLLYNFKDNPDEMDLKTICKIEAILGKEILIVPTKQQWRKIKLQHLNDLNNEETEESTMSILSEGDNPNG